MTTDLETNPEVEEGAETLPCVFHYNDEMDEEYKTWARARMEELKASYRAVSKSTRVY
jgi:hypothetical protein